MNNTLSGENAGADKQPRCGREGPVGQMRLLAYHLAAAAYRWSR